MRKQIAFVFCLVLIHSVSGETIALISGNPNLILNGDFSQNTCTSAWCISKTNDTVRGWIPDPEIEIGYGNVYNLYLNSERVIELAPNKNSCVRQIITNVPAGIYQFNFTYAARQGRLFADSQFNVSLNGQSLTTFPITPSNYMAHNMSIDVEFKNGCETEVKFCGVGRQDNSFGAVLKKISLTKKFDTTVSSKTPISIQCPSQNLVFNGNFAQTDCLSSWCISTLPNFVKGWIPDPEIEIGYGSVYSSLLKLQRVLELAPNKNSCVKQMIPGLLPGFYQLSFEYLARNGRAFTDCELNVALNGKVLKTIIPANYNVSSEVINLEMKYGCETELKFCGIGGDDNSFGALLKSVRLVKTSTAVSPVGVDCPVLPSKVFDPVTGFSIDSSIRQCYSRVYDIQTAGDYLFKFDYKISSPVSLSLPYFKVYWDTALVYNVSSNDNGSNVTFTKTSISVGQHTLMFCPAEETAGLNFPQASVQAVTVTLVQPPPPPCVPVPGEDLIVNGGFNVQDCTEGVVPCGWSNDPQTSPGFILQLFPSYFLERYVSTPEELESLGLKYAGISKYESACFVQTFAVYDKENLLSFDWINIDHLEGEVSAMTVTVNGKKVGSYWAKDNKFRWKEEIKITVDTFPTEMTLGFCYEGDLQSNYIFDNVKFRGLTGC